MARSERFPGAASARAVVVDFLHSVVAQDRRLDQFTGTPAFLGLSSLDRAFAHELAHGILRQRGLLDFYFSELSDKPIERLDAIIAWVVRLGLYEIEFLRTPERAAVHESVGLSRVFKKGSAAGFVNAVLRQFCRERPALPSGMSPFALSVRYSHPLWLVERYLGRYGEEATRHLLERNNTPPLPVVWVNRAKIELAGFCRMLAEAEIEHCPLEQLPGAVLVQAPAFSQHPIYRSGYCFFMDPASQEIADLPSLERVENLGDFCAGSGSKAFLLAARKPAGSRLYCSDISFRRLHELRSRAGLYGLSEVPCCVADLTRTPPFDRVFDFVLLDVPCTGLGTVRSNPDIKWKILPAHLSRFQARQVEILRSGFATLRPGARLLYATCSTEPEENEQVVEEFLRSEPLAVLSHPYHRTYPENHAGDCFFAAEVRHI